MLLPFRTSFEPCLATLRDTPPRRGDWLHEIKYDGYRSSAHLRASAAAPDTAGL
jgi:bifunctional non-homologous end joining protein LigD